MEWTEADRVFQFVDWLVGILPLRQKLHLMVRQKESAIKQEPTAAGDFVKLRNLLGGLPLAGFSLSNHKWISATTELFVAFENVHYTYAYAGSEPQKIEVPKGVKVFSFSLRRDIWEECEKNGASLKVLENVETLFAATSCMYGYADVSIPLITGGRCVIGNRAVTQKIRIVDFDYARHVEKIYRYNYLSTDLLRQTANLAALRELKGGVQYKDLYDATAQIKGAAIYLKDVSEATTPQLAQLLGPVLWAPA